MKKLLICLAIFFASLSCQAGFLTGVITGVPDGSLSGFIGVQEHRSQSYIVQKEPETQEDKDFRYLTIAVMFSSIPLTFIIIYLLNVFLAPKKQ